MSWDIHGQPLTPGHCEVHPEIGHPYPCYRCQDEREAERALDFQAEQEYEALAAEKYDEPYW